MQSSATKTAHKTKDPGLLDERRLWVGNLDPRVTEFQLLKILQKCGAIDKFDMLFHKNGPLAGQPRGYAFVTFANTDAAINALEKLNGTILAERPVSVRLAKNVNYEDLEHTRPRIEIPALGTGIREGKVSKEIAIRAIEAKLKSLEQNSSCDLDFNSNGMGPQIPIIQRYQFNKDREQAGPSTSRPFSRSTRPYNRNQRPRRK